MPTSESFGARAVRFAWYPFVLASTTGTALVLLESGATPGAIVAAVGLLLIPVSILLELQFPETPHWHLERGEVFADFLHKVLSNPIPTQIFTVLFYGLIVSVSGSISEAVGLGLWPTHWPLAAQGLLTLFIAELVNYGIHRGYHESRLWPLHAVHHCSPRMYFYLAGRKHPLLATPEFHRIHHSKRIEEHNSNFGDSLSIWDRLFRSYTDPDPKRELHDAMGIPAIEVPQTYWAHLKLPFDWKRVHQPAVEVSTDGGRIRHADRS